MIRTSQQTGLIDTPVDVIVPTRNRPQDIARFLPTLTKQTHENFRALIIDQSDDSTPAARVVAEAGDARIVHIPQRAKGKSKALNLGLAQSSSPVVAFTDDDCTLPPQWLEMGASSFQRAGSGVGLVFGNVLAAEHDPESSFIPSIMFDKAETFHGPTTRSYGLIGIGANMFVKRDAFQEIGGFDEDLGPGGLLLTGEECELTYRALCHGISVARDPSVNVVHWGARPIAGDVAKRLVTVGYFAVGAGYGKHLRSGDLRTVAVVGHETAWVVALLARAAAMRRRPLHVRRLMLLWQGIAAGFRRGLHVPVVPAQKHPPA